MFDCSFLLVGDGSIVQCVPYDPNFLMQLCVYMYIIDLTNYVNIEKWIVLYILMKLRCFEHLEQTVQYDGMVVE